MAKIKGAEYVNYKGQFVPALVVGPDYACKKKCCERGRAMKWRARELFFVNY